jgi:hypothetical protein
MAKKKNIRKGKSVSKGKRPLKQPKKTRKPNRYNAIRSASSKYCKKKYGKSCTNAELNEIYREIKKDKRFTNVPLDEVIKKLDLLLGKRDQTKMPSDLDGFMWWDTDQFITYLNKFFFKKDDKLIFDLSEIGMKPVKTTYKDFPSDYRTKMYSGLRNRTNFVEDELGETLYPVMESTTTPKDAKNRKFSWKLNLGVDPSTLDFSKFGKKLPKTAPKRRIIPQKGVKTQEKRQPTPLADKNKRIELVLKELELGLLTKKEAKEKIKKIDDMYNTGGNV